MMADSWTIVKVGGSLYDLPNLGERIASWLDQLAAPRVLLVPGGGATADAVRALDRVHGLDEETSHWLALQALSINARFLQALLPGARLVDGKPETLADASGWYALDAYSFFLNDDKLPDHLPHIWDVTSDSLAVRVATLFEAPELVLLKSVNWHGEDWEHTDIVDRYFARAVRQAPPEMRIRLVNLRAETG